MSVRRHRWLPPATVLAAGCAVTAVVALLLGDATVHLRFAPALGSAVLAAGWLAERRRLIPWMLPTCVVGVLFSAIAHFPAPYRAVVSAVAGPDVRKLDPTTRLAGWRELAGAVDSLREELRASEGEPLLAATRWNVQCGHGS